MKERSNKMPVQFILGEHPTERRKELVDDLYNNLSENPNERILYLVPDNVKYETETMILEKFKNKEKENRYSGMIRLQVFSFSRLAWYLLQNKPIYQKPQLTESGLAMLIKTILQEEEEQLTIFKGASQQTGFIERLVRLFMELRNGKVTPNDLMDISTKYVYEDDVAVQDFKRKMNDLSLIYQRYDERLSNKYVEKEDLYSELITYIKTQKSNFKNVSVIVDHYEHFSAQEQELLLVLAKNTKSLSVCLTLNDQMAFQQNNIHNPYYRSAKTYHQLNNLLLDNQIEVLSDKLMGTFAKCKNENNNDVMDLAQYWIQSHVPTTYVENSPFQNKTFENIEVWAAEDTNTEIMHIATKIKRMVASGKYRYKDFQIMTREIDYYRMGIDAIFTENELPYFIDQAETMSEHPLLEFIVSLFSMKKRNYRLNDIFRFLRTELYCPFEMEDEKENFDEISEKNSFYQDAAEVWRNKVDIAENVALAYGYQGNDWVKDENWLYARFDIDGEFEQTDVELEIQKTANEVRETVRTEVVPFIELLNASKSNREVATMLYSFMEDLKVPEQIQHWRDQLIEYGDLEEARKHEQAWDTFIQLLDEFVEVLGGEAFNIDLFLSIMETGFEQATFSMVPPTIDQVLVTNFDLPKIQSKNVVILIGLTDSQLPKAPSNQSLLTDEDRERVDDNLTDEKYLASSEMESFANEPFAMYLAILQSNEKLIFSYPIANEENKENRMSPYLVRIMNGLSLRPQLKYANAISTGKDKPIAHLEFVGSKAQTFGQLLISLRYALDVRKEPSAFWVKVFEQLYNPKNYLENRVLKSLSHKNIPVPLPDKLAEELYGKDLYLSVSQLETFYADPFSHFLIYGLRLKERQIQELSPLETGNFFHDALDHITSRIFRLDKDVTQLTDKEVEKLTADVFNLLIRSNKYRLSQSSSRMRFIFHQLSQTVKQMVWSIVNQSKRSELRTSKTELLFGRLGSNEGIQGLSFPLKSGGELYLRGKVDRIDTFAVDNQLYAGIVDYKSSATTFDYQKMYYGLMMQMITYLDTVLTYSKEIFNRPAKGIGAFYSRVHNPYIDLRKLGQKEMEEELLKSHKYDGLIVNRQEILKAADTELTQGTSPVFPIRLLANGSYSGTKILTEEEFELLIRYNRDMIIEAGNRILSGENMLKPFEDDSLFIPSVRGSYHAISQFDALLPENNYQEMLKLNKEEFFSLLRERYNIQSEEKNE